MKATNHICAICAQAFLAAIFAVCLMFLSAPIGVVAAANSMPDACPMQEKEQYKMIACFSTYYGDSSQNRKHNIALASRKIDGTVLYPEDEFSFNDTVGARTIESGFQSAYIIQNGEFVEGVGGGVCQVSSTLYNCALLADLAITCVRAHSLKVSYVAASFDAMVSSTSDLRFVNVSSSPITIKMKADGKYLRAEMYGIDKKTIKRRSQTIENLPFEIEYRDDPDIEQGKQVVDTYGKEGLRSQGFLEYYDNGKLTKTVLIRQDTYSPQKRIVLRGVKSPLT